MQVELRGSSKHVDVAQPNDHLVPTAAGLVHLDRRRILELEDPLPAERAADGVVERAEVRARDVRLVVARVEVIGDVEHLQPDRRVVAEEHEPLRDLRVERDVRGRWRRLSGLFSVRRRTFPGHARRRFRQRNRRRARDVVFTRGVPRACPSRSRD